MQDIESIVARAAAEFAAAGDSASLENAKAKYLGKAGELTALLKRLGTLAPEEKKSVGQAINTGKQQIEAALDSRRKDLELRKLESRLAGEALDVTLPGRGRGHGGGAPDQPHLAAHRGDLRLDRLRRRRRPGNRDRLVQLHRAQQSGEPSGALDAGHLLRRHERREGLPLLLRTHTSPMQVRYARMHKPPIKVIAPGRTYRVDSDATHSPMFHQVEGLWIDEDISFADLKGVYVDFLRRFFESDELQVRFRPVLLPVHRALGRDRPAVRLGPAARGAGWSSRRRPGASRRWCAISASTRRSTSASRSARASSA
jgi:phenylalanyl-tRNA synthetase alpha chain